MLQYAAVALQTEAWNCYKREDYKKNQWHLADHIRTAVRYAELDLPVKLVALPEGALGGWAYWAGGEEHLEAYKKSFVYKMMNKRAKTDSIHSMVFEHQRLNDFIEEKLEP